jgi:hypothetical protein
MRFAIPELLRRWGRRGGLRGWGRRRSLACWSAVLGILLVVPAAGAVPGDPTPPVITPVIVGTLGSNGWYTSNVTVNWKVEDPESVILSSTGCGATTLTTDTAGTKLTCTATSDGGEASVSKTFRLDKTPPSATPTPARSADANGWYNHPFSVAFSGTDATSGIASCSSSAVYSGPDSANASVSGSCRDLAGNLGSGAISFMYDSTPPAVPVVKTKAGNRRLDLRWTTSRDAKFVEVVRSPGVRNASTTILYRGSAAAYRDTQLQPGAKYQYRVTSFDEAANGAGKTIMVTGTGRLLSPVPGALVTAPPLLTWTPLKAARYYNVQLIRRGKILSTWPTRAQLQLPRTWVFRGHRYRLHRGVYRWYVWPGYGRTSAARYGGILGGSSFSFSG